MEHLLLKAATTAATDEGVFTAVISAATIDREKDVVDPAGMVRALAKWIPTGKKIPLAWNHSTKAEDQIGYIDPNSARVENGEVVVDGWVDQGTEVGAHAWRLVKAGTLGFSFGYLTLDSSPRKGGGRLLKELDVFEVTASPTPMNNDTRVVGWKAASGDRAARILSSMLGQAQEFINAEPDAADLAAMRKIVDSLKAMGAEEATEPPDGDEGKTVIPQISPEDTVLDAEKSVDGTAQASGRAVDPLRAKADALALEFASGGQSLQKPPRPAKQAPPPDLLPLKELKQRMRAEMLTALSGGTEA